LSVGIELGSHIVDKEDYDPKTHKKISAKNAYQDHYVDILLICDAPTYEEVIIEAAARVDRYFFPDSTEREGTAAERNGRMDRLLNDNPEDA
jgi:hypothetical protein